MKPDLTKAREILEKYTRGCDILSPWADCLKAIIDALDPQPEKFDWATVKPRMAFRSRYVEPIYFVGFTLHGKVVCDCSKLLSSHENSVDVWDTEDLTRATEHDKVQP